MGSLRDCIECASCFCKGKMNKIHSNVGMEYKCDTCSLILLIGSNGKGEWGEESKAKAITNNEIIEMDRRIEKEKVPLLLLYKYDGKIRLEISKDASYYEVFGFMKAWVEITEFRLGEEMEFIETDDTII